MEVASLVLGIVSVVIAFIPCLGVYAIIPAVLGVIFGAVGLAKANKNGGAGKGMAIAGLVCSILATAIAGWQIYAINKAGDEIDKVIRSL